jgi:dipeptidase D
MGLKGGLLSGSILLNLDTEDDRELTIGCAGGVDVTAEGTYDTVATEATGLELVVKGLTGGHSGMEIHLGRGNANKLMNRLLLALTEQFGVGIAEIDGGGLRNAIPRESHAKLAVAADQMAAVEAFLQEQQHILSNEYNRTDPGLKLAWQAAEAPAAVLEPGFQGQLLRAIYACPNGIYRMSPEIEGLVQTSNNLARVLVDEGDLSRSSA